MYKTHTIYVRRISKKTICTKEAEVHEKFNCLKTEQFSILSLNNIQSLSGNWLEFNNFNIFKPSVITMQAIWNKQASFPLYCLKNAKDIIIVGDMNIYLLKHSTTQLETRIYL